MTLTLIGLLTDTLSCTFNAVSREETIPFLWILLFKAVAGICPGPVLFNTEAVCLVKQINPKTNTFELMVKKSEKLLFSHKHCMA